MTTEIGVIDYILPTYAINKNIAIMESDTRMLAQLPNKTLSQYAEDQLAKIL